MVHRGQGLMSVSSVKHVHVSLSWLFDSSSSFAGKRTARPCQVQSIREKVSSI